MGSCFHHNGRILPILSLLVLWPATCLWAQTGPELLLKPWPTGQRVQAQGEFALLNSGSTRNSDDFQLSFYDTSGRVRLLPGQRADPRLGWNYTDLNTSGDSALPSHLIDTSVGFGIGVADWSGWLAGITLGIGYAGAGAFDDGNAWYGMGDFAVGHTIDKTSAIGFVLDYNGNRTFCPDVPLPGFLYTRKLYPQLILGLGFPFTSIEYHPTDQLTITGKLDIPDDFEANIDYEVIKSVGIFAGYTRRLLAFHWDQLDRGQDRVIYYGRRAELGVRWTPVDQASLIVAGGYAFSQEFNVGFDTRDQDRIAKPSDEPYVRAAFELRF